MGAAWQNSATGVIVLLVALSVVIAAIGLYLFKTGRVSGSRAGLVLAILSVAPLFGAGAYVMVKHQVQIADGETPSGVNATPAPH